LIIGKDIFICLGPFKIWGPWHEPGVPMSNCIYDPHKLLLIQVVGLLYHYNTHSMFRKRATAVIKTTNWWIM